MLFSLRTREWRDLSALDPLPSAKKAVCVYKQMHLTSFLRKKKTTLFILGKSLAATGGVNFRYVLITATVHFQSSCTVLHLPRDVEINYAIMKAAEVFKLEKNDVTVILPR